VETLEAGRPRLGLVLGAPVKGDKVHTSKEGGPGGNQVNRREQGMVLDVPPNAQG